MNPTDEQIKKFWERCGFWQYTIWHGFMGLTSHKEWIDPKGDIYGDNLPPIDLNNLFKYAVPKLKRDGYGFWLRPVHRNEYAVAINWL